MGNFKGNNTTTSTTQPNAQAMGAYSNLLARAGQIANTPYQAYGGEGVAGINEQQRLGFNNINANAGFAMPYIQQAGQYAQQAAQPISAADIQRYENPYTNDVINAQQAQYNQANAQQQSQVMGNAAAQGALGGNRAGVAQALTAGQQQMAQAPVLANLRSQGYQSGLNTALAEQQNLGQAAYSLGNLGVAGQNAALTGANAQIGAGTMQQQTQQALDQYLYGQFQQQQAYPYQQLSWLAGIDTGVGSQMGGSSQTTGPSPNPWSQWGGLGLAGLGLFMKRGGRVPGFAPRHYDSGGGVAGMPWAGAPSWIPAMQITHGKGAPAAPSAPSEQKNPFGNPQSLAKGIKGLGSLGSSLGEQFPEAASYLSNPMEMLGLGGESTGGAVFERGGGVHGYAEGGAPDYGDLDGGFDPDVGAFSPTAGLDAPVSFLPARHFGPKDDEKPLGSGTYTLGDIDPASGFGFNPIRTSANRAYDEPPTDVPLPRARPGAAPDLPPAEDVPERRIAGVSASEEPTGGLGSLRAGSQGTERLPASSKEAGFGGLFHLSDAASTGLMAAGLGMMASRSPFLGNAIGEGGLAGMSAYAGTKQEEVRADEVRKKLEQHAEETRKKLESESAKEARLAEEMERGKVPPGYRFKNGMMEPIPGGPHDPTVIRANEEAKAAAKNGPGMSPEAKEVMARAMISGNYQGYNSLGRTAQGLKVRDELNNMATEIVMRERGANAQQAAQYLNDQKQEFGARQIGINTEARTTGQREANLNLILKVADAAVPAALELNDQATRLGSFTPLNRIIQKGEIITSDPVQARFGVANLQLAESWARAMNPTGVMRDADRDLALKHLDTALSNGTYKAVVLQIQEQIKRERDSIRGVDPRTPLNLTAPPAAPAGAPAAGGAPPSDPLAQARAAIARGAPRDKVIERLRSNGVDPSGL